jgi:hypothetical protein
VYRCAKPSQSALSGRPRYSSTSCLIAASVLPTKRSITSSCVIGHPSSPNTSTSMRVEMRSLSTSTPSQSKMTSSNALRLEPKQGADPADRLEVLTMAQSEDLAAVDDDLVHGEVEAFVALLHLRAVERTAAA